jgi:hypothetical protein
MTKPVSPLVVWSLALGVVGCSAISDFDDYTFGGGEVDAGPPDAGSVDSGDRADAGPDAGPRDGGESDSGESDAGRDSGPRMPTGIVQTAGGAVIITSEYQLRISIGAPQPIGHRDDGTSRLTVGPGSL